MSMSNVKLLVRTQDLDFTTQNGETVKGTKLHYLSHYKEEESDNFTTFCETLWIKADQFSLLEKAHRLAPGQFFQLQEEITPKRKVIITDIAPGELAVDWDSIFRKGDKRNA